MSIIHWRDSYNASVELFDHEQQKWPREIEQASKKCFKNDFNPTRLPLASLDMGASLPD
jgi:hypothetical protein